LIRQVAGGHNYGDCSELSLPLAATKPLINNTLYNKERIMDNSYLSMKSEIFLFKNTGADFTAG
jgi:hypothetical protein